MEDTDSSTLVRQVAKGDATAFEQLYQQHAPALYTYLLHLLNDEQAAQDVLQTSFLIVWQQAGKFREQASVHTWLLRIAYFQAIDWLRKNHRNQFALSLEDTKLPEIINYERVENEQELMLAIKTLKAEQRALLELAFIYDLSLKEIALVLNCPIGTAKSRLHRTLRLLSASLQRLTK
jgi:RNA polymerase sigma-70 factor (ECF subfamily)